MTMSLLPKIRISDEAARPLVNAVLEVFSPATELLGWVGDAIRVHRTRTVLRCFARTKEIAAKAGIGLKAPPTKFLAQYIENCSLEEETDRFLIEWWSRLLVDASTNYQSRHVFYVSVLKQLTAIEVELLECIVRNGAGSYKLEHTREAEFVSDFNFSHENFGLASEFKERAISKSIKGLRKALEIPGVLLLDVFVDDPKSNQRQEIHPDYSDGELANWQILQSLQLIRLGYQRFTSGGVEYRVRSAKITELGAKFYFSCHEAAFDQLMSTKIRFRRRRQSRAAYPDRKKSVRRASAK
jgi:hypothetical protein